jgi:hypothetical protein
MRAKEMVHKLLQVIADHGDLDLNFEDYDDYGYDITSIAVRTGADGAPYVRLGPD